MFSRLPKLNIYNLLECVYQLFFVIYAQMLICKIRKISNQCCDLFTIGYCMSCANLLVCYRNIHNLQEWVFFSLFLATYAQSDL